MAGVLRVGLTGGIACGRTTASATLRERGMLVLDADAVVHSLLGRGGGAVEEVAAAFGPEVLAGGGGISRRALGAIVFADRDARSKLESILHPKVLSILDADTSAFERRNGTGIVVVDAALMVETGSFRRFQRLVVTHCPTEIQLERLMRRDGLSRESASARLAAQAPLASKIELADYVIRTGGSLEETRNEALRVAALLEEDLRSLPNLPARPKEHVSC
jgi:dephospho-CoA kinase